jgi:hypothetical protein
MDYKTNIKPTFRRNIASKKKPNVKLFIACFMLVSLICAELYGVMSQNAELFISAAMRTSNRAFENMFANNVLFDVGLPISVAIFQINFWEGEDSYFYTQ